MHYTAPRWLRSGFFLAMTAVLLAGDCDPNAPDRPRVTASVSPAAATVAQGGSTVAQVMATRSGVNPQPSSFSHSSLIGATGISVSFSGVTTTGFVTNGTMTVNVGASQLPGVFSFQVIGSGTGADPIAATFTLTVVPAAPDYSLSVAPTALPIEQGTSGTATVTINRTTFTSAVTLSLGGAPAGITGSFAPAAPTGTTSTLTVNVAGSVTPGTYSLTVDGTGTPGNRSTALTVTVTPTPSGVITWTGAAGTSDWFTAGNWDLNRLPAATDEVIIALAGANVAIGDSSGAGTDVDVNIRKLTHSAGTLRLTGPSNCANCARLDVSGAIDATGATTRLLAERAEITMGVSSTLATLESGEGVWVTSTAPLALTPLTIQRLNGRVSFDLLDVTIATDGTLAGGMGVGRGQVTIGAGASVAVTDPPVGLGRTIDGVTESKLIVNGTLAVDPTTDLTFELPVTVGAAGRLEVTLAYFNRGVRSHGTILGSDTAGGLTFRGSTAEPVELATGSRVESRLVSFDAPTTVAGEVVAATQVEAAPRIGGTDMPFTVEDASLFTVGNLVLGPAPAQIRVPSDATFGALRATTQGNVRLLGAGRLSLGTLQLGSTTQLVGGDAQPARATARLLLLNNGSAPGPVLDNVAIEADSAAQVTGTTRGRNGARIINTGTMRFSAALLEPVTAGTPGSLYFEHRGSLLAGSGPSTVRACIITGSGATILPPTGTATLTLDPLPPAQCP